MRAIGVLSTLFVAALVAFAAPAAPQSKSTSKKTTARPAKKKPGGKASAKKATATRYRRSAQQQPTAERYKEIQQALAGRGYFQGRVDGKWGADSVGALKRFQRDQNLSEDGKIGSLSLIALGLGPKRASSAKAKP